MGCEVVIPPPAELTAFREHTRAVYDKWTVKLGADLVRSAEKIIGSPQ